MIENNLYQKSHAFAIRAVEAYKYLTTRKKEYVLSKQFLKSGTSIGANIAEANGAISKADFSAKISIAYKESLESKYWLSLLKETNFLNEEVYWSMFNDVDELGKIMYSILRKSRNQQYK
jgi:four helix bundle protein